MSYHTRRKLTFYVHFLHFKTNTFTCNEKFPLTCPSWAEICRGILPDKTYLLIIYRATSYKKYFVVNHLQ